jgi:hypothetical protein
LFVSSGGQYSFTYGNGILCFAGFSFAYQLLYLLDATAFYSPALHVLGLHVCRATGQELVLCFTLSFFGVFIMNYAEAFLESRHCIFTDIFFHITWHHFLITFFLTKNLLKSLEALISGQIHLHFPFIDTIMYLIYSLSSSE